MMTEVISSRWFQLVGGVIAVLALSWYTDNPAASTVIVLLTMSQLDRVGNCRVRFQRGTR